MVDKVTHYLLTYNWKIWREFMKSANFLGENGHKTHRIIPFFSKTFRVQKKVIHKRKSFGSTKLFQEFIWLTEQSQLGHATFIFRFGQQLKSVHFKKTVARSLFLSKLCAIRILLSLTINLDGWMVKALAFQGGDIGSIPQWSYFFFFFFLFSLEGLVSLKAISLFSVFQKPPREVRNFN